MRHLFSAIAIWLIVGAAGFTTPAHAVVSDNDTRLVQSVVRAQLAAFAVDDADKAFSFAAPELRGVFGTSAVFLQMVRGSYPVVYRPASVTFLLPKDEDDSTVLQPVQMKDAQGASWLALYRLQRQADKSWRIAGCSLVPSKDRSV